jgi:hypothetical protein
MPQDIKVEEIGGIACEPTGGFDVREILYADIDWFDTISAPKPICDEATPANEATTLEEMFEISADHTFLTGYGFMTLEGVQESTGLESTMIGEKKRRLFENKLSFLIAGSTAKLGGFTRWAKNRSAIVLVPEAGSGRYRQIGSERFAAEISELVGKVEATVEGDNSKAFTIMDKQAYEAPIYKGTITKMPTQP